MSDATSCAVCLDDFDIEEKRPAVGTCGHSICSSCLSHIQRTPSKSCPRCTKFNAFAETKINYQMIEVLEEATKMQKELEEIQSAQNEKNKRDEEELSRLRQADLEHVKEQEQLKSELEKAQEAATTNNSKLDVEELSKQIALKMLESNKTRVRSKSRGRRDPRSTPKLPADPVSQDRIVPTSNTTNLFVSNLNYNLTDENLYNHFRIFGYISSVKVLVDANGSSKGYGFVCFRDANDANDAISGMNLTVVQSRTMYVKLAEDKGRTDPADHHVQTSVAPDLQKSGYVTKNTTPDVRHQLEKSTMSQDRVEPKNKTTNLFVSNLSYKLNDDDLYKLFKSYGHITSAKVMVDASGSSRGRGFVCFRDGKDAQNAISGMNSAIVHSRPIYVKFADDKEQRKAEPTEHLNSKSSEMSVLYKGNTTQLHVCDLDANIQDDTLYKLFENYGSITSAKVITDTRGKSRGFGFVSFRDINDAINAMSEMDSKMIGNKRISVKLADHDMTTDISPMKLDKEQANTSDTRKDDENTHAMNQTVLNSTSINLFIGNLDKNITSNHLHKTFERYGDIISAKVMETDEGVSKGFGFVSFLSAEDGLRAKTAMNSQLLGAKQIYINEAQKKEVRKAELTKKFEKNSENSGVQTNENKSAKNSASQDDSSSAQDVCKLHGKQSCFPCIRQKFD